MDKTVQIVVVVMVLLLTAGIVMSLFSLRVGPFGDEVDNIVGNSSCDIAQQRYENACDCSEDTADETDRAAEIEDKNQGQCQNTFSCENIC